MTFGQNYEEPAGFYTLSYLGEGGLGLLRNKIISHGLESGRIKLWLSFILGILGGGAGWYGGKRLNHPIKIGIGSGVGLMILSFLIQYWLVSREFQGLA